MFCEQCEQCEQSVSMLTNFISTTCKMLNVFCERLLNFWISWLNANCKNIKQEKIKVSVLVDNQRANLDTGWERREVRRMIRFDVISCFWMIRFDGVSGVATDKQQLLWAQVAVLATLEIVLYLLGENYFFEQLQDVEFRIDFVLKSWWEFQKADFEQAGDSLLFGLACLWAIEVVFWFFLFCSNMLDNVCFMCYNRIKRFLYYCKLPKVIAQSAIL